MNAALRPLLAAIALTVGLAACGDKEYGPSTGATSSAVTTGGGRAGDYGAGDYGYASETTGGASTTTATGSTGTGGNVTIKDFTFHVPPSVKAGQEFTITNEDGFNHTFTEKTGKFDVAVAAGTTEKLTVAAPGTYELICQIHARMHGTLVVT